MSITCQRCNKLGLRRYVDLGLDIPIEFEGNLTWYGQFLIKTRDRKYYTVGYCGYYWTQDNSKNDVVEWLPIGDDYDKVKKAWLKAKGANL